MEEYIHNHRRFSAIRTVIVLTRTFPNYIYINDNDDELHYFRKKIIETMKQDEMFLIGSFERCLKRAGLEVIQTTHDRRNSVKKWMIKPNYESITPIKKRSY